MSDYVFMDWQPVCDDTPKMAVANDGGKQYVVWAHHDGFFVAQRTVDGRRIKWHQRQYGVPTLAEVIMLAEQWRQAAAHS